MSMEGVANSLYDGGDVIDRGVLQVWYAWGHSWWCIWGLSLGQKGFPLPAGLLSDVMAPKEAHLPKRR